MAEETIKNQIVHLKNNSLLKVSSTLALTNKLLQEIENRNVLPSNDFRVSIPDINFQKYLTDTFGIVITDNSVAYGDIKHIEKIKCSYDENKSWHKIKSLEGIQHFTALIFLGCSSNQLTDLDVSKNTALTSLNCGSNQLRDIDVSKNTALTYLNCFDNHIAGLDVSKNMILSRLVCGHNQLAYLDVSQNKVMSRLYCDDNQLTDLDVSQNKKLTHLYCGNNKLTELDISQNKVLTSLHCFENQIKDLYVSQNTALKDSMIIVDKTVKIYR